MLEKMLEGMDSEFKVVLAVVSGSIVATASWVICWCCGNDLSGGALFLIAWPLNLALAKK